MQNDRLLRLLEFLDNDPNDSFILYALATEYNVREDNENALFYYHKLSVEHENYIGTYYHYAKLLDKLGKRSQALEVFKKGIQIAQNLGNRHALSELKNAYYEISDEDEEEY